MTEKVIVVRRAATKVPWEGSLSVSKVSLFPLANVMDHAAI